MTGLRLVAPRVESVTQPDAAIAGIVVSFSVVPAALIGLSLLTLARYRLRRADIDARLTSRRTGWNSVPRRKLEPPARRRAP